MQKVTISIDGKEYPCRGTMGAMLRFKRLTGKEVTEIEGGSLTELATYLYCCVVSASKHDGIDFPLSLDDFADSISPDDLNAWAGSLNDSNAAEDDGASTDAKKN